MSQTQKIIHKLRILHGVSAFLQLVLIILVYTLPRRDGSLTPFDRPVNSANTFSKSYHFCPELFSSRLYGIDFILTIIAFYWDEISVGKNKVGTKCKAIATDLSGNNNDHSDNDDSDEIEEASPNIVAAQFYAKIDSKLGEQQQYIQSVITATSATGNEGYDQVGSLINAPRWDPH